MPNYAWNEMSIKKKDFDEFVKCRDENCPEKNIVDFNVLIPMPADISDESGTETDHTFLYFVSEKGTLTWNEIINKYGEFMRGICSYSYDNLLKHIENEWYTAEDLNRMYKRGEELYEAAKKYGAFDWYNWRYKYWGTKWNAFDCELEDWPDKNDPEEAEYKMYLRFTTAWGAPEEWIKELAKHCDFTINTDIEGCDDRYRYVCENGELNAYKTEFVPYEF
jgi:hypothetical protein